MQRNWFKNFFGITHWYLPLVLWNYVTSNATCPPGTYKNDFLSGGCALCPKKLEYCEYEQLDDATRCFKACRKILSTPPSFLGTTHATPESKKPPSLPPVTSIQGLETRGNVTTERVSTGPSSSQPYVIFKEQLNFPTSSNKQSSQDNWKDIIFGIVATVLALLVLIVLVIVFWWKSRNNSTDNKQQNSVYYAPVLPDSSSNSDQNISHETSENIGESDDVENIGSLFEMRAVSQEDFENLPEAHV